MTNLEIETLKNLLARLTPATSNSAPEIVDALKLCEAHGWLETWVRAPLQILIDAQVKTGYERKDSLRLAHSLSR